MKLAFLIFSLISNLALAEASNNNLKKFLVSCGYGTVGGAAVGLVSLAFESSPQTKLNNIAKGASLGLYAGIGYGLYQIYGAKDDKQEIKWAVLPVPSGGQFLLDAHF
jgi:hypothetical protein